MALIAVLSLLALLTMLALGALHAAKRHGQLAQASFVHIQQRELADSALRVTIMELTAPAQSELSGIGRRSVDLFGSTVIVDSQREAGRIDLNFADEPLLVAAFAGNGYSENEARALAACIIDWRDADDVASPLGAERAEYRRAHRTIAPRNAPFETVAELRLVVGGDNVTDGLLDAFTVYSHRANVEPAAAGPEVLRALHWAQERQLAGRTWLADPGATSVTPPSSNLAGEVLRLKACGTTGTMQACRTAVLRLTGDWDYPALVLLWQ